MGEYNQEQPQQGQKGSKDNFTGAVNDSGQDRVTEKEQTSSADNSNEPYSKCPQPFIVKMEKSTGWTIQEKTSVVAIVISTFAFIATFFSMYNSGRAIAVSIETAQQARKQFEAANSPFLQVSNLSTKQTNIRTFSPFQGKYYSISNITFTIENLTNQPVKINNVLYKYISSQTSIPPREEINKAASQEDISLFNTYLVKESPYTHTIPLSVDEEEGEQPTSTFNFTPPRHSFFNCQIYYTSLVTHKARLYEFTINLKHPKGQNSLTPGIIYNENIDQ